MEETKNTEIQAEETYSYHYEDYHTPLACAFHSRLEAFKYTDYYSLPFDSRIGSEFYNSKSACEKARKQCIETAYYTTKQHFTPSSALCIADDAVKFYSKRVESVFLPCKRMKMPMIMFIGFAINNNTNYKVSASVEYGGAADPKTNLGKPVEVLRIPNGTKNGTSGAITGYRDSFWGSVTSKEGIPTSAVIRGLSGKKGGAIAAGNTGDASEAVGAMRVIIAVPAPRTINSIKDVNGLNAEAFSAFTHITVKVEGANKYDAVDYNVYYKDSAAANDTANKWHFTVA